MSDTLRRLAETAAVLLGVMAASFLFLHWLPGDPAELYAGEGATDAEIDALRQRMGLDEPVWSQALKHVGRLARGDLGRSLRSGRPVRDEIAARLPTTLSLAAVALTISAVIALLFGIAASAGPGGFASRLAQWAVLSILAVPVYWWGILLLLVVVAGLGWSPPAEGAGWTRLLLPGLALGLHTGAATARVLGASLTDVLGNPYVRTAHGKGLSHRRVLLLHALPNALIPAVAFFATEAGRLLGGAVLTETVFGINGIGRFLVQSIEFRDYPAVVGVVCFAAVAVTTANAAADLACRLLDPRTRRKG